MRCKLLARPGRQLIVEAVGPPRSTVDCWGSLLARPGRQLIVEAAWTSRSSHNSDDCDSCARWVWSSEWLFRACRWVRQVLATAKVLIFRRRLELLSSPKAWQRRCCYSLLLTTRCVPCVVCNSTQINSAWIIVIFFVMCVADAIWNM